MRLAAYWVEIKMLQTEDLNNPCYQHSLLHCHVYFAMMNIFGTELITEFTCYLKEILCCKCNQFINQLINSLEITEIIG